MEIKMERKMKFVSPTVKKVWVLLPTKNNINDSLKSNKKFFSFFQTKILI